jgi:hypothetical protein
MGAPPPSRFPPSTVDIGMVEVLLSPAQLWSWLFELVVVVVTNP